MQGTASPFFSNQGCNKLGYADAGACPNGKLDLKAHSTAWEVAHVETLSDGTGVCVTEKRCLDNACCDILAAPSVTFFTVTSGVGTANDSLAVPNNNSFVGLVIFHQWAVLDVAANTLGIVVSNAGRATVGN